MDNDRIDIKMLEVLKVLYKTINDYIYKDYKDNYINMMQDKFDIGSYINELNELSKKF